jgi:predicted chitinase
MRLILIILLLVGPQFALADAEVDEINLDPNEVGEVAEDKLEGEKKNCTPEELEKKKKVDDLRNVFICALNKTHPAPPPAARRLRTLEFIADRMVENFESYGLKTDVEKAHLLANVLKETGGLGTTVERTYSNRWQSVMRDKDRDEWQCKKYLENVDKDAEYFNDRYKHSKDTYNADFRGRGLIQLTHCYNYLGFFFHKAAIRAGKQHLAEQFRTDFYYKNAKGKRTKVGSFCTEDMLKQVETQFNEMGLDIKPGEIVKNFRKTMDKLAVPCKENRVGTMSSQEFIVDSTFWYWQSCQRKFPKYRTDDSDETKAKLNGCVHGADYSSYISKSCPKNNSGKPFAYSGSKWIHKSWCHRKNYFNALKECMDDIKKENNNAAVAEEEAARLKAAEEEDHYRDR